jgi:hypothetical protein
MGPGTVVICIMCDGSDKTNHGFPVGTDGISQLEEWGTDSLNAVLTHWRHPIRW